MRELVNALETALAKARYEPTLFPKHLPTNIRINAVRASVSKESPTKVSQEGSTEPASVLAPLRDFRMAAAAEAEKEYLQNLVSLTRDDIKDACRISRLSRSRLYELLKKHKISIPL